MNLLMNCMTTTAIELIPFFKLNFVPQFQSHFYIGPFLNNSIIHNLNVFSTNKLANWMLPIFVLFNFNTMSRWWLRYMPGSSVEPNLSRWQHLLWYQKSRRLQVSNTTQALAIVLDHNVQMFIPYCVYWHKKNCDGWFYWSWIEKKKYLFSL